MQKKSRKQLKISMVNRKKAAWTKRCLTCLVMSETLTCHKLSCLGGGFETFLIFHPDPWEEDPMGPAYFSIRVATPPTSCTWVAHHFCILLPCFATSCGCASLASLCLRRPRKVRVMVTTRLLWRKNMASLFRETPNKKQKVVETLKQGNLNHQLPEKDINLFGTQQCVDKFREPHSMKRVEGLDWQRF